MLLCDEATEHHEGIDDDVTESDRHRRWQEEREHDPAIARRERRKGEQNQAHCRHGIGEQQMVAAVGA
jgi:hypothetical protein